MTSSLALGRPAPGLGLTTAVGRRAGPRGATGIKGSPEPPPRGRVQSVPGEGLWLGTAGVCAEGTISTRRLEQFPSPLNLGCKHRLHGSHRGTPPPSSKYRQDREGRRLCV